MTLSALELLQAAKERLSDPNHWVQHDWARDEHYDTVDPTSPNATCWCLGGALMAAAGLDRPTPWSSENELRLASELLSQLDVIKDACKDLVSANGLTPMDMIVEFNDLHITTNQQVLEVLDQAIAMAELRAAATKGEQQ